MSRISNKKTTNKTTKKIKRYEMLLLSDGPALISVNIYLRNIHKIDDVKMVREEDRFDIH